MLTKGDEGQKSFVNTWYEYIIEKNMLRLREKKKQVVIKFCLLKLRAEAIFMCCIFLFV